MFDDRLRSMLEARAQDLSMPTRIPKKVLRRTRTRIAVNVVGTLAVVAAIGLGATQGIRALTLAEPVPPAGDAVSARKIVLVYSDEPRSGGPITVMYGDGRTEEIVPGPRFAYLYPDMYPPYYTSRGRFDVIAQRLNLENGTWKLAYVDMKTREQFSFGEPRGSRGLLAVGWDPRIVGMIEGPQGPELRIIQVGTDLQGRVMLADPDGTPVVAASLGWDRGARHIYVVTDEGHPRLLVLPDRGPAGRREIPAPPGSVYVAAHSPAADTVHVVEVCCSGEGVPSTLELAEITGATGSEPVARTIAALPEIETGDGGIDPARFHLTSAGTLQAEVSGGRIRWSVGSERSWIFVFDGEAWLVTASGQIYLGEMGGGGVKVAPRFSGPRRSLSDPGP